MINNEKNIIGGLPIIKRIPDKGEVNSGVIIVDNSKVLGLKELLNIRKL